MSNTPRGSCLVLAAVPVDFAWAIISSRGQRGLCSHYRSPETCLKVVSSPNTVFGSAVRMFLSLGSRTGSHGVEIDTDSLHRRHYSLGQCREFGSGPTFLWNSRRLASFIHAISYAYALEMKCYCWGETLIRRRYFFDYKCLCYALFLSIFIECVLWIIVIMCQ